ncbi:hypothetical protein EYF80_045076 [Liparis tanakae]|uniref:Uncharacterized protein n=1 Tax=Liparis tanakae TaxID=230148 RepID=A0A4Z2FU47_9TELE|nr:hypothetical protein EYF80_045076 [Liparis tanakae]
MVVCASATAIGGLGAKNPTIRGRGGFSDSTRGVRVVVVVLMMETEPEEMELLPLTVKRESGREDGALCSSRHQTGCRHCKCQALTAAAGIIEAPSKRDHWRDSPHAFRVEDMCCAQCGGAKETLVQYVRFHHIASQSPIPQTAGSQRYGAIQPGGSTRARL